MKIVCLANSNKEGGRCIAGIELDENNNAILENGHPKWIRPICLTLHGEVPTHLVSFVKILDIIEMDVTGYPEVRNYQSENVLFRENSIKVSGHYDTQHLNQLCDNRDLIFGNRGKAVHSENIGSLLYSLMLIKTNKFEVIKKTYADNPNNHQIRLLFLYNGHQYDFPVTDPEFLHNYHRNEHFIDGLNEMFLSLSLTVEWMGWYYKLVAGIILNQGIQK